MILMNDAQKKQMQLKNAVEDFSIPTCPTKTKRNKENLFLQTLMNFFKEEKCFLMFFTRELFLQEPY